MCVFVYVTMYVLLQYNVCICIRNYVCPATYDSIFIDVLFIVGK